MFYLHETLKVFTCMGVWKSRNWSRAMQTIYDVWTSIIVAICVSFFASEVLDLVLSNDGGSEVVDNVFLTLSTLVLCAKVFNLLRCREEFERIANAFDAAPFASRNVEEGDIKRKLHRSIGRFIVPYATFVAVTTSMFVPFKLAEDRPPGVLPFRSWVPFNHTEGTGYWLASCYQLTIPIIAGGINTGHNVLFCSMMTQILAQARVFKCRLNAAIDAVNGKKGKVDDEVLLVMEKSLFGDCVEHHVAITKLAEKINRAFSASIFLQYLVSSTTLCCSTFLLTSGTTSSGQFAGIFAYVGMVFFQILILCTSGHYTTLEFSDVTDSLYNANWLALSRNSRNFVHMIMLNSARPFVFSCCSMVDLNFDSFKTVIKLSYSVYNIL